MAGTDVSTVNVEAAQAVREDVGAAMRSILADLATESSQTINDRFLEGIWTSVLGHDGPYSALKRALAEWAAAGHKPLVLLLDEIDALVGDALISGLRQLRSWYRDRPRRFPQSVVLCCVRDMRDYRIFSSADQSYVAGGSAFNIKAEALRLGDFSRDALAAVWALTRGQPWLVNAPAYEACF